MQPPCRGLASASSSLQQCLVFISNPGFLLVQKWKRKGPGAATEQRVRPYLSTQGC